MDDDGIGGLVMSATDFLPRRGADLRNFSVNFNSKINADPEAFGLTREQATEYNVLHNEFMAIFALANAPSTRTPTAIQAKKTATIALRKKARQLAGIIRAWPGITDTKKAVLGLTIRTAGGRQRPFPPPRSAPLMSVQYVNGSQVSIRLRDADAPTRRGRPVGVNGATLMFHTGDTPPPARMSEWSFLRLVSRTTLTVSLPTRLHAGAKVWLVAAWQNPRAQLGPFAQPVSVHKQFGFVAASPLRLAA